MIWRQIMKLLILLVTLFAFSYAQRQCSAMAEPRTNTEWSVVFWKRDYSALLNQTTLYYNLTAKAARECGSSSCKDLSHWSLGFCPASQNLTNLIIGSSATTNSSGYHTCDPTTAFAGYKFDMSQKAGTTVTYYIILRGNWTVTTGEYAVKGGTYYEVKSAATLVPCKGTENQVAPETCEDALPKLIEEAKPKLTTYTCKVGNYKLNDTCYAGKACNPDPKFTEKTSTEWDVKFIDYVYNPVKDVTTFKYNLTAQCPDVCKAATKSACKDLSHWVLGVSSCLLKDSRFLELNPGVSFGCDPTTSAIGMKWDQGQKACTSQIYEVNYPGVPKIGITYYSVKGGTYYSSHPTIGPVDTALPCPTLTTYLKYVINNICPGSVNSVSPISLSFFAVIALVLFLF